MRFITNFHLAAKIGLNDVTMWYVYKLQATIPTQRNYKIAAFIVNLQKQF
jgi:hypothetical protein